jgi:cilia- and flagella-associated protein 251
VSFDGRYLFSAGGKDLNVNKWSYHLEKGLNDDIEDYHSLLDGGKNGKVYNDIVDYFYYCQIRAQGENALDKRDIIGR